MENNVDRSAWGMGALAIAGGAIGALMVFMPELMNSLTGKITEMISSISF